MFLVYFALQTNDYSHHTATMRLSYQEFNTIYDQYADSLYAFALHHLKSRTAAEDIVQDTFMKLWSCREQVFIEGNLHALIFTIAKHQIIDSFRRQLKEPHFETYTAYCESAETEFSPEDLLLYDEFKARLADTKQKLTGREREIYELSREQQLSIAQIAEQLGLSVQTVKYNLIFVLFLPCIEMME
jgi:RNA polymerase sigma-70 factor (family 1)